MARPVLPRVLVLVALAVGLRHWGSLSTTYAVKGSWQGEPGAVKGELGTVLHDLEPKVNFPPITYSSEGVALSVEDGQLNVDYATKLDNTTSLSLHVNDAQAWKASLSGEDASLLIKGQGKDLDSLSWEAAQKSSVEGVGDVKVEFNSDKAYNLTVTNEELAEIAGALLAAKVRATNDGVTGHVSAKRALPQGAEVSYSVENPVGVYNLAEAQHIGRLSAPVAGGSAALEVEGGAGAEIYKGTYSHALAGGEAKLEVSRDSGALGYNVSYARGLGDVVPVGSAQVGVDEDGVYGKVNAGSELGNGVNALYEALARLDFGANATQKLSHALKLSNRLGSVQLLHGKGEAPRLRVGYEFNA